MITQPTPDCRVADTIVHWANEDGSLNVHAGDQILHDGEFRSVVAVQLGPEDALGHEWVRVQLDGLRSQASVNPVQLVAVRRYQEGASPEARWAALRDWLGERVDEDYALVEDYRSTGDLAQAAPFGGRLSMSRAVLARMTELEQR